MRLAPTFALRIVAIAAALLLSAYASFFGIFGTLSSGRDLTPIWICFFVAPTLSLPLCLLALSKRRLGVCVYIAAFACALLAAAAVQKPFYMHGRPNASTVAAAASSAVVLPHLWMMGLAILFLASTQMAAGPIRSGKPQAKIMRN